MVLSFEKLSFSQVTKLHQKYKVFYESWASKNPTSSAERQSAVTHMTDNMMDSLEGCGFNDTAMSMMEFTGEEGGIQEDGNSQYVEIYCTLVSSIHSTQKSSIRD